MKVEFTDEARTDLFDVYEVKAAKNFSQSSLPRPHTIRWSVKGIV
jgi:hypothetical protein